MLSAGAADGAQSREAGKKRARSRNKSSRGISASAGAQGAGAGGTACSANPGALQFRREVANGRVHYQIVF